jgi:hypothetical protein
MMVAGRRKGLIILGLVLAAALIVAFLAYRMTGPMGIEERYGQAVGLPAGEGEEEGGGPFGFSVEGDPFLYGVVLVVLGGICAVAYLRWRRTGSR